MEDKHQLKLDLEELRHLQSIAQRRRIINFLSTFSPKTPNLFFDILNSEKKLPPPPQSSQSKQSKSSAVSKIAATDTVKQLENQQGRHREATSFEGRPKEENKADKHQLPNPERFSVSMKISDYVEEYEGFIIKGKQRKNVKASIIGR